MENKKWVGNLTNTSDVGYGEDFYEPNTLTVNTTGPYDPIVFDEKKEVVLDEN